ncbi:putative serine/threonine-protein kinase pbl10 [Quercus suber]|uniref:Serine/threonine-protein kinase pbl10 n=1 Tax=Quercus suber TaxID=58331 RepID=A0AAW0KNU6_QUESU
MEVETRKPFIYNKAFLNIESKLYNATVSLHPAKLYRGTIRHGWLPFEDWVVTVKIWDYTLPTSCHLDGIESFNEEVMFLTQPSAKQHPNVVNLLGYCNRRYLEAVVYDLNPLDTVRNLATTGSLTWLQRIKVALGFARALEFLHDPKKPYLVRNINAAHIILDQDCNPKIFDFSTMSGGILGKLSRPKEKLLTVGYDDPEYFPLGGPEEGGFEVTYHDVFSYGVVLLGLITKRIVDIENIRTTTLVYRWAWRQYRPNRYLVHESLVEDPGFYASDGISITELAMRCIQRELDKRPSMKDVVKRLEGLQAVQLHGNVVGIFMVMGLASLHRDIDFCDYASSRGQRRLKRERRREQQHMQDGHERRFILMKGLRKRRNRYRTFPSTLTGVVTKGS